MMRSEQEGPALPPSPGDIPSPVPAPRSEALEAELAALEAMLPSAPTPPEPAAGATDPPDGGSGA